MTLTAMLWVMKNSPAKLGARLVLIVLADFAHDDGSDAFPSVATLSERTRLSERGVRDALRKLEQDGAIVHTGDRPNGTRIYRLEMGGQNLPPAVDDTQGGQFATDRGAEFAPDPSTEPTTDPGTSSATPKMVKIVGRNLGFDELASTCQIDTRNRRRVGEITKALKEIRGYVADDYDGEEGEPFERRVASEIARRAALYRDQMRNLTLTPLALAKWWHDLENGGPRRGPTASDFPEFQDDL